MTIKEQKRAAQQDDIERIFSGFAIQAERQIASQLQSPKKKIIVIAGPTACGKSDFAVQLAKTLGGEIVSADSMQVYKNMDIGTAKPTLQEQAEVPHHLIDIRHVTEIFNVVDYYFEARHCSQVILTQNKIPIVVGGSGFYIHSMVYGPPSGPPSVPELRRLLEEEIEVLGSDVMYERLQLLDPVYASTITKNDKQKIVRALEIIKLTGKKVSKMAWRSRHNPQHYDFRCWFLYRPRDIIYKRVEDRCDQMLQAGLLKEVEYLKQEGICSNPSASQAIGYRQALDYLETSQTEEDYEDFVRKFKQASRNYAKRQFTWFRREPLFRWLDLDMHDPEVAMEMIRQDYERC